MQPRKHYREVARELADKHGTSVPAAAAIQAINDLLAERQHLCGRINRLQEAAKLAVPSPTRSARRWWKLWQ